MANFGVILGFITGNVLLAYVSNGNTEAIIYIKEIVIASLGLLLVPKKVQINIADFFGKDLYLPVGAAYEIEANSENTIYKLNTVSETINEMAKTYKEESKTDFGGVQGKKAFEEALLEKIESIKDNTLYDEITNEENGLIDDIFETLQENGYLVKDDVIKMLEKRNEYIIGFENFDTNMKVEEDINKAISLINDTYKIGQINNIWKQRMKESKKVISSQLNGVSRVISDVAK